jgi:hypothetical protein
MVARLEGLDVNREGKGDDLRRSQGIGHTWARDVHHHYIVSSFHLPDLCGLERRRCRFYSASSPSLRPDQRNPPHVSP